MITQARIKQLLAYNAETGVFVWKADRGGNARAGRVAGTLACDGYVLIRIDVQRYYAHRLAWLYVYGRGPAHEIDHIDGNRANNRLANLREATRAENCRNICKPADNTSGHKGVDFRKDRGRWRACIRVNGKQRSLGCFATANEAGRAYDAAAQKIHGIFSRPNRPSMEVEA